MCLLPPLFHPSVLLSGRLRSDQAVSSRSNPRGQTSVAASLHQADPSLPVKPATVMLLQTQRTLPTCLGLKQQSCTP